MTFNEYQQKALSTAKDKDVELIHRALGLAGEAGEVAGKLTKWLRDTKGDELKLDKQALGKELGDVLWFVSGLCSHLGLTLQEVAEGNISKLSDRQMRGVISGDGDER